MPDGEGYWGDCSTSDRVHIQVDSSDGYEQTYDDSGTVLFDGSGVKIVYKYTGESERVERGKQIETLWLYIENNTGKDVQVNELKTLVDGQEAMMGIDCDMPSGTRAVTEVTFLQMDGSYIESFDTVEIRFRVTEEDVYEPVVETPSISIPL